MGEVRTRSSFRPDIQALRAVAVLAVLLFHLWPGRLTGGYVGVDVFFAISGFLITSQLLHEAESTGRISLPRFWARRARRLLPASLLVLAVTVVLTYVFVPANLWEQYFDEIRTSTFYIENWQLAGDAVDYLASANEPSAVQHFWTLSVEEQFYAVWPLVIGLGLLVARRRSARFKRSCILGALVLIVSASLAYSLHETALNPARAYFVTTTRAWEFGVGAIAAFVWPAPWTGPPRVRSVLSWAGLGVIVVSATTYTASSPFPGYLAGLPVVGALMVIIAGPVDHAVAPTRLARLRPVQYVGDLSYSLYLWHFPLIVVAPYALGGRTGPLERLAILVVAFLVAAASKRFVEDPLRFSPRLLARRRPLTIFACSVVAMATIVAISVNGQTSIQQRKVAESRAATKVVKESPRCLGAAAMDPHRAECNNPQLSGVLVPDPTVVSEDYPDPARCWSSTGEDRLNRCTLGPHKGARKRIAVLGDSHAGQYRVALARIAKRENWRVDVITKAGCYWTRGRRVGGAEFEHECAVWNRRLRRYLARHKPYDAIVVSHKRGSRMHAKPGATEEHAVVHGLVKAWRSQARRGTEIISIRDNPQPRRRVIDCVAQHETHPNEHCSISRSKAFEDFGGQARAAQHVPRASLVDLADFYCDADRCKPVIGHVMVYRKEGHITDTYVTTLTPYLRRALVTLV